MTDAPPPTESRGSVTVIGAGLGGALMAAYLGQAGYAVDVRERRADPRGRSVDGGRSINLAISTRGLHALEGVGLRAAVLAEAVPMRGRLIHARTGDTTFQPYSTNPEDVINSVSRGRLNEMLIDAAEAHSRVSFNFGQCCTDLDVDSGTVEFAAGDAASPVHLNPDFLVGADGAFSAVRGALQRRDRFEYAQSYLLHGYKELHIPATDEGRHRLEPNALHIWPRRSFMMIALPNTNGSFTCTLFLAFDGRTSFAALDSDAAVERFFAAEFGDAVPLMPGLLDDFRTNPTSSLVTVRCSPYVHRDRVVLLGDACHAVVPFYGQGANAAFEDCAVLADLLRQHPADRGAAFARYDVLRRPQVNALADLAIANFVEMRDHTGSRWFRLQKRWEALLHRLFPRSFLPLYSMVSFSRIPYAQAVARAQKQWAVVRRVTGALVGLVALIVYLVIFN